MNEISIKVSVTCGCGLYKDVVLARNDNGAPALSLTITTVHVIQALAKVGWKAPVVDGKRVIRCLRCQGLEDKKTGYTPSERVYKRES